MRSLMGRIAARFGGEGAIRQLARGTLVSFLIQGIGAGLIFFSEILMARVLGAGGYGLFATVMAWLQVLVMVALLGSNHLLLRFVPTYVAMGEWPLLRGLLQHCGRISLAFGMGLFLAAALLLAGLGGRVAPDTRWAFLIGMAVLPVAALSLQRQAILRGLHRVAVALSPELIVRPALLMLLAVGMAWGLGMAVTAPAALAMNGAAVALAFLLGWYWQRRTIPRGVKTSSPRFLVRDWRSVAVPLFLVGCMQLLLVRMDIMLLGALMDQAAAGVYAAASRTADLVVFALGAANIVAAPMIATLHARGDTGALQRLLRWMAAAMLVVTLPIAVIILGFGREILGLFGAVYQGAYVPLQLLVFGQLINALCGPVGFLLAMTGNQVALLRILAVATLLNLALNLLLIPYYGIVGAAISTGVTTVFWNVFMVHAVQRRLGVQSSILTLWQARS